MLVFSATSSRQVKWLAEVKVPNSFSECEHVDTARPICAALDKPLAIYGHGAEVWNDGQW